jgi:chromosome partitioning protein
MATHEPDRSTRRRWFRTSSRAQPSVEQPEVTPDDEPEAPLATDVPHADATATVAVEDNAGVVAPGAPPGDIPSAPTEITDSTVVADAQPADGGPAESEAAPDPDSGPTDEEIAASMTLPRVISIANQKGGVGKTTTAVNLGAALAEIGYRVLVVDLDPQGNATTGLGISHRNVEGSIYDVIMNDTPVDDCVEPTSVKNLFVCPATIDLAGAEIELVPAFSRELKLKRALQGARDDYDFTLIDCPPSLGLLTVNGLAASDDVIVPIQCEYYALEGLGQLLRNVALVKSNLNPELEVRGIVLTMYDARTRLAVQVEQEVREHFGPKVYRTVVPRTVRISEAPSFGEPIIVFDPSSRGAIAYRELAKEVSRGTSRRAG